MDPKMALDDYLTLTKPFGMFQKLLFLTTLVVQFMYPFLSQIITFIGVSDDYHCKLKSGNSLSESIPPDKYDPLTGITEYSKCLEYADPGHNTTNETQRCSEGYQFDDDVYGSTLVTEFELVCDDAELPEVAQSVMMMGGTVSALFLGQLSDKFGRRPVFIATLTIYVVCGCVAASAPNFIVFVVMFTLQGSANPGFWAISSINLSEHLTPDYRSRLLIWPYFFSSIGIMTLALLAFFVRDWRYLLLIAQVPFLIMMLFVRWYPESSRWLLNDKKQERADKCMIRIAAINKVDVTNTEVYKRHSNKKSTTGGANKNNNSIIGKQNSMEIRTISHNINAQQTEDGTEAESTKREKNGITFWHIFKPPVLLLTIVLSFTRMSYNIVYFGFALSTGKLAGNPYINFFLSGVAEIPGRIIPLVLLKRLGGRNIVIVCYLSSGVTLLVILFLSSRPRVDEELSWLITTFALLGKMFITSNQPLLVMLALELNPTDVRSLGNGFSQAFGRFGGVLAPFVLYLEVITPSLPAIVMATVAFISSFLIWLLPDARNEVQPRNAEDLRELMRRRKSSSPSINQGKINMGYNKSDKETQL